MAYRGGFNGGFGGGGNQMQNLMKQAQKMQQEMQKAQEELAETELTGTAGNGMVSITVSGNKEILGVSIAPEVVDPDDVEMLEDLIMVAFNDAMEQVEELSNEKLGKFGGGLGGMF